ncbi:MAG: ribosome assembly RNA-binding protein YhbY [Clostridia bacterium]|nr:ribosome assembly RNA-binding protein YhbY [Oscillospiraceae bacterium]MBR6693983.1 ribosome assembly RNA-binding protein YhbY [Clostridia bacterium]
MLTGKQRAQLRALANSLETIFQVGKSGINDQLIRQVDETLEARELIKLRVLETSPQSSREAADKIAEETGADVVQVIGSRFVLYRESKEHKKIVLVKKNG